MMIRYVHNGNNGNNRKHEIQSIYMDTIKVNFSDSETGILVVN